MGHHMNHTSGLTPTRYGRQVTTQHRDTRSLHRQIAATIREQIMSGALAPGVTLPSTQELCTRFGAANTTIQNALVTLKKEGWLSSRIGKAVWVRDHQPVRVQVGVPHEQKPGGVSYRILDVGETGAPVDVARAFGVAVGTPVMLRYRMELRDGEPSGLSWSYYPMDLAVGTVLSQRARVKGGAPQVLAEMGFPEVRFSDRVTARMPTALEVEALQLPAEVPVLRQFLVTYSVGERPVEVSVIVFGAHVHELWFPHVPAG
jgi:GntR family transcriptional regulator